MNLAISADYSHHSPRCVCIEGCELLYIQKLQICQESKDRLRDPALCQLQRGIGLGGLGCFPLMKFQSGE